MILPQVTVFITITKLPSTTKRHYPERLVVSQLAETHITHLYYPNLHGVRQYGILIIALSRKLNVIPHWHIPT